MHGNPILDAAPMALLDRLDAQGFLVPAILPEEMVIRFDQFRPRVLPIHCMVPVTGPLRLPGFLMRFTAFSICSVT